jgi:large subunit ribosomal protein L13
MRVIDASNAILGRFASNVAKALLNDEEIVIVNSEKAIIVGDRKRIIEEFKFKRRIGDRPRKGPYWPRLPDRIMKRAIRGMLPYQKPRGRIALKKLRVYLGIPQEFINSAFESFSNEKLPDKFITLQDLSRALGAKL